MTLKVQLRKDLQDSHLALVLRRNVDGESHGLGLGSV